MLRQRVWVPAQCGGEPGSVQTGFRRGGVWSLSMARLGWCLAALISWGKVLLSCFFPLRAARRDKVSPSAPPPGRGVTLSGRETPNPPGRKTGLGFDLATPARVPL